jgi:hypothetical protein
MISCSSYTHTSLASQVLITRKWGLLVVVVVVVVVLVINPAEGEIYQQ